MHAKRAAAAPNGGGVPGAPGATIERFAPWILLVAGLLAYANSFTVPFLFDDVPSIVDDPRIRHFWPIWHLFEYGGRADITVSGRPIATVSFALNYALGGLQAAGYHAFNLAIHIASSLLIFGIVRRTLRLPRLADQFAASAGVIGFAIALLWLVHPIETKAVTFLVQRVESLAAFFYVLTLYALLRGVTSESPRRWFALAIGACALGMGTKEIMASAPIAAFLFDAIFVAGSWRAAWKARGRVYTALAVTWAFLATLIYITVRLRIAIESASSVAPIDNLKTQSWAILHYLRLVVWPSPLIFDYGMVGDGVPLLVEPAQFLPYALPIALLLALTVRGVMKLQPWSFPAAAFFMILAPSSSVVPFRLDIVAEHRMYLPLAALFTFVVIGVAWILRNMRTRDPVLAIGALVLAVPLGWCTHLRNRDFASDVSIWTDTAEKLPGSARAQTNLGVALFDQAQYEAAIARHHEAIRLRPDYSEAYHNLASALMFLERPEEAEVQYRKALELVPNAWPSHLGLAEALLAQDKTDEAAESFVAALSRQPEIPSAYVRLGIIRQMQGRAEEAVRLYEEALRRTPNDATVLNQQGLAFGQLGRFDLAADRFGRALRIDPGFEAARGNLERARAAASGQ